MTFKLARIVQLCASFVLVLSALATAQVHTRMQGRTYTAPGITMAYRLFVPANYDRSKAYPFLVAMHGVGEKGNDNTRQVNLEDLVSTWIADSLQNREPHFVLGPQCPTELSWGSDVAITAVHAIIDSLKREFSLDTNRLYAVGLSMGARGTFNLVQKRPGYFAAALACAGAGTNSAAASIARTPLWAFHGSTDGIVDVSGTRSMVDAIAATGITFVRFTSQTWMAVPQLDSYSKARLNGTSQLELVAKNPSGISYDSLRRAVTGGAKYLYSEITGGDHRTGWMAAFHHPLVPQWIFTKSKAATVPVHLARQPDFNRKVKHDGQASLFVFGQPSLGMTITLGMPSEAQSKRWIDLQGRRLDWVR